MKLLQMLKCMIKHLSHMKYRMFLQYSKKNQGYKQILQFTNLNQMQVMNLQLHSISKSQHMELKHILLLYI